MPFSSSSDTDSAILLAATDNLEDCLVNPETDLPLLRSVMVDTSSNVTQAGKLKVEGKYLAGIFR